MPPKTTESWKEQVRDWWYSIQDLLAEKDICLHERKRVEIETIIKDLITTLRKETEEAVAKARREMFFKIRNDIIVLEYDSDGDTFKKIILSRMSSPEWFEALTPPDTK